MAKKKAKPKGKHGGQRTGAGRPEKPKQIAPVSKKLAGEILESLGISDADWKKQHPDISKDPVVPCKCEKCLWRRECQREDATGSAARKFLWEQDRGKAVHTVNHLHDKPLDVQVTHTVSERMMKALERAEERVRNR